MKQLIPMVFIIGMLCACGDSSQKRPEVRSVELTTPELQTTTIVKNYSGIVREAHNINLAFKTAGQIKHINVKEGDYVRKGQLLATLDATDYQLGVEALQIQYDQLKSEVERTTRLFQQQSISANDYEKAIAGLKQLGVQLQVNKNKLNYTKLYAPIDGYIQSINFSPAEMVDAGTALFTLLDVSHMEVVADIPVGQYRLRNHCTDYFCRISGAETNYPMKLLSLTPKADGNQLYQLRLSFSNHPDNCLTAGMNVEVSIHVEDTVSSVKYTLPLCTVFQDNGKTCVWIFESDSTVSKRPVELDNIDSEGRAVVIKGLTGKEQIVRAGVNVLQEGEKVHVIEMPNKTNVGGLL